jgi:hypothetical protein
MFADRPIGPSLNPESSMGDRNNEGKQNPVLRTKSRSARTSALTTRRIGLLTRSGRKSRKRNLIPATSKTIPIASVLDRLRQTPLMRAGGVLFPVQRRNLLAASSLFCGSPAQFSKPSLPTFRFAQMAKSLGVRSTGDFAGFLALTHCVPAPMPQTDEGIKSGDSCSCAGAGNNAGAKHALQVHGC